MNAPPKGIVVSEKEAKLEAVADDRDDDYIEGFDEMCSVTQLDAWRGRLQTKTPKDGPEVILPTLHNAVTILTGHTDWRGVLEYDLRRHRAMLVQEPPFESDYGGGQLDLPRQVSDGDAVRVHVWAARASGIKCTIGKSTWFDAIIAAAEQNGRDRFREYLERLEWDGQPRLDRLFIDYAGAADDAYSRLVARILGISIAARTFNPGEKVDTVPILEGPQGKGKSTFLAELVGHEWFSDKLGDIHNKDTLQELQGPALIEVAELEQFSKKEAVAVKAFLTRQVDKFRPPYARADQNYPRRVVFCGTTNDDRYLRDATGGRRFLPIRCVGTLDPRGVAANRDQILAESVARYRTGEQWWVTDPVELALCEDVQEGRFQQDPWEPAIEAYLEEESKDRITAGEIFKEVLVAEGADGVKRGIPFERQSPMLMSRVSAIMRRLGWERGRVSIVVNGKKRRVWGYAPKLILPF